MARMLMRVACLVVLAGLVSIGHAQAAPRVYLRIGPPAVVMETRPPVPHPGYVWRGGYHRWVGGRYEWFPGAWVRPPYPLAAWIPGRWERERRGWYWLPGHWARH
jgi:hypothetical protein